MLQAENLERVLHAVGELMRAEGATASIVVVGGASLSLLGLIPRTTRDVDVIARMEEKLIPPDPLPPPLVRAILTVARDLGLSSDWMNTDVALQWKSGLPPHLEADIRWHTYEALRVGLVGRRSLLMLKLFAAVDGGPGGVHFQDLLALHPSGDELDEAAAWVRTQDASEVFATMLDEVVARVRETTGTP